MKYLLALYGEEGGWDDVTPEEMQAGMKPWNDFSQRGDRRRRVRRGRGAAAERDGHDREEAEAEDEQLVTDGPFAETKEQLGGFYLLECENLDEALEWAKKVPLTPPGSIEVRPVMDYSEFGYDEPNAKVGETRPRNARTADASRPPVPARVGTGGRDAHPRPRRLRPRRGGGPGGVPRRARALAGPRECRTIPRPGSSASGGTRRSTGCGASASSPRSGDCWRRLSRATATTHEAMATRSRGSCPTTGCG